MTEHFSHLKNKLSQNWLNASILDVETTRHPAGKSFHLKFERNQQDRKTSSARFSGLQSVMIWERLYIRISLKTKSSVFVMKLLTFEDNKPSASLRKILLLNYLWFNFTANKAGHSGLAYKCFSFSSICCYRLLRNQRKYNYLVSWIKHLTNKVNYLFHCACMPTLI